MGVNSGNQAPRILILGQINLKDIDEETADTLVDLAAVVREWCDANGVHYDLVDVADDAEVTHELSEYDGLLVLGGGDVDGELAGHTGEVPREFGKDRRSDDRQITYIHQALDIDLPLLGICRGSQLLNVSLGGTLHKDLGENTIHRAHKEAGEFLSNENVTVIEGTNLAGVYGAREVNVRTYHHQAVKDVAPVLRVAARAADGLVEAVEHPDKHWVTGVQWHPEDRMGNAEDRHRLFRAFIEATQNRA